MVTVKCEAVWFGLGSKTTWWGWGKDHVGESPVFVGPIHHPTTPTCVDFTTSPDILFLNDIRT